MQKIKTWWKNLDDMPFSPSPRLLEHPLHFTINSGQLLCAIQETLP